MEPRPLRPVRCIVDRTVLVELLETAWLYERELGNLSRELELEELQDEVEQGQRVELYSADWPATEGESVANELL